MGFTLIELLVVIGIIAVLAALLLPVLAKAKDRANKIACMNNLHEIGLGLNIYAGENGDKVPSETDGVTAWPWDMPWDAGNLVLSAVGGSPKIFYCPSTAPRFTDWQNWQEPGNGNSLWNYSTGSTHITGYVFAFWGKQSLLYWTNQNLTMNREQTMTFQTPTGRYQENGPVVGTSDRVIGADTVLSAAGTMPGYTHNNNYVNITGGFKQNGVIYPHLSNHVDPKSGIPEGQNLLYKDGHANWQNFNLAILRGAAESSGTSPSGGYPFFWW